PDETAIRRANADALRQAGYAADAIDEYRYCATASPDDADVHQRIAALYVGIGRPDDAAGYLIRALQLYSRHGEYGQLAGHAESLLELRPASLGDLIDLLSTAPGDALVGRVAMLDELTHRVMHAGILDAEQKAKARSQLSTLYQRLLLADAGNEDAQRAIDRLKDDAVPVERRKPTPEPTVAPHAAEPAAAHAPTSPTFAVSAPVAPTPVAPAPVVPAPVVPAPVVPAPVTPAPVAQVRPSPESAA